MPAADAAASVRSNHVLRRAADNGKLIYDDDAWIGAATRRVRCWCGGSMYEIRIAGIGSFSVSSDGHEIFLLEKANGLDDDVIIEVALGPALVLALAIRGVFCLHASAVKLGDGAVLFLGESAAGKSTLAEMLEDHGAGLIRVTDDISPLKYGKDRFELLPDFPQLKLTAFDRQSHIRFEQNPGRESGKHRGLQATTRPGRFVHQVGRSERGQPHFRQ